MLASLIEISSQTSRKSPPQSNPYIYSGLVRESCIAWTILADVYRAPNHHRDRIVDAAQRIVLGSLSEAQKYPIEPSISPESLVIGKFPSSRGQTQAIYRESHSRKFGAEYRSALPRIKDNKTISVADEDAPEEYRGQQSILLGC
jgi:hypothetical protein